MKPNITPSNQPCWTCKKACGGCSWSKCGENGRPQFAPVDGWKAIKTIKKHKGYEDMESYKILFCPEYEKEEPRDEYAALEPKVERLTKARLTTRQIALILDVTMADVRKLQRKLGLEVV